MCYSPLLIRSNARYKNLGYKTFNFVPCNDCFQCRTMKADSYYVRAFKEFQLYNDSHCMIMFVLLTYNETFLPRVSNDSLDYIGDVPSPDKYCYRLSWSDVHHGFWYDKINYSFNSNKKHRVSKNCPWDNTNDSLCNVHFHPFPTFSTDDIDKFFKKIRSRLKKHLGYIPNISYFLVAENGDKRQRPHYHILFFIDLPKSFFYLVKSIIIDSWTCRVHEPHFVPYLNKDGSYKRLHRDGSPYGYIAKTTKKQRGLVMFDEEDGKQFVNPNDPHVSRYLSQYLTTDPYFDTVHHDNLKQLTYRNQQIYRKKFGPFRLCSHFFGISALWDNSISKDSAEINIGDCTGNSKPLPLYYYRYIYYSKDDTGRYVRNANYTNLLIHRIPERYEQLLINFKRFYEHIENDRLHPKMFEILSEYYSVGVDFYVFKDIENFKNIIKYISYSQAVGYYLILYLLNLKCYHHGKDSLSYARPIWLPYTLRHLGNKEFVFKCLENLYRFQQKAPFIGDDSVNYDVNHNVIVYDVLCTMFSIWLKFDLVKTNENKFVDWNKKAKSLGKAKYLARPHALIQY